MMRKWSVLRPYMGCPDLFKEVDRVAKELGLKLSKQQREEAADVLYERYGYEEIK